MIELLCAYYVPQTILDAWNASKIFPFMKFTLDENKQ